MLYYIMLYYMHVLHDPKKTESLAWIVAANVKARLW